MALNFMFKGAIIGFSIAAPVGPIGVLCIRRSLADGQRIGLATGLGAATADAIYGCIAGFGLTAISNFLVGQRVWLGILGGLFLCYLGIRTLTSKPVEQTPELRRRGLFSAYVTTFVLTLTNPVTVLSFISVFAGLGLVSPNYLSASTLVAGVFIGSALWWLLLSSCVSLFRSVVNPNWMRFINRLSGSIILGFGVYSLLASFVPRSHEVPPEKDAPPKGGHAVPMAGSGVPDGSQR